MVTQHTAIQSAPNMGRTENGTKYIGFRTGLTVLGNGWQVIVFVCGCFKDFWKAIFLMVVLSFLCLKIRNVSKKNHKYLLPILNNTNPSINDVPNETTYHVRIKI